jgi:hypothetical protein
MVAFGKAILVGARQNRRALAYFRQNRQPVRTQKGCRNGRAPLKRNLKSFRP